MMMKKKKYLVWRESIEWEHAYVEAESKEKAKKIAEEDDELDWKWVGNDSMRVTDVEETEETEVIR